MHLRKPLLAFTVGLAAAFQAASAADLYATALGGLAFQQDSTAVLRNNGVATTTPLSLDSGFAAGAAIGWRVSDAYRLEAEFMYQSVDHPFVRLAPGVAGEGNFASTSVAFNALRDINLGGSPSVRSYVGAGLVYLTEVDLDFEQAAGESSYSGSGYGVQLLAGVRYESARRLFIDVGARYLLGGDPALAGEAGTPGSVKADYRPLSLTLALGWKF